jgi:inorganic pyrophosphatase
MNPWHDVKVGDNAPEIVNGIIEIPKGSRAKYELDKETGMIMLDRVLSSPMYYPANYGFIPKTYCDDNDPLDILVLCQEDLYPNTLVEAKVIGVMHMIDGGEGDDKIIAVAKNDPAVRDYNELDELPGLLKEEIEIFFADYKKLEKKTVEITGFGGREKALQVVNQSIIDYNKKFGK